MSRLRTAIFNALLVAVIAAACATAVANWLREPQVEHVRVYRYAPGR